ncbi:MAG: protein jag [Bdellovibrionales bacterium]
MGFLSKLFGGGKKSEIEAELEEVLQQVLDKGGLSLSFDIKAAPDGKELLFDLYGEDEERAKEKEGMFLDSLQLFLRRVLQNKFPEERKSIIVDCDSFREDADQTLIELADKLKGICLKKKKPVYFRAFPPRERKIIHQYLSEDDTVKSKSVGEGLYKKIKIFPAGMKFNKRKPNNNNKKAEKNEQQAPA